MSLSISGVSPTLTSADYTPKQEANKPSVGQQIQTLASSGQSAAQIAASLGIPVTQVDSTLGTSTTSAAAATATTTIPTGRLDAFA